MDELQKLFALVPQDKQAEAQGCVDAVKAKIDGLDAEVNKQESQKLEAIKTRDEAKAKYRAVTSALGVGDDESAVDAVAALKTKKSGGDESVKDKEIATLKQEIVDLTQRSEVDKKTYQSQLLTVALEKDVAVVLPKYKAKTNATAYIIDAVKSKAVFEDGKVVFKNADGTTVRHEGRDATLDDMVMLMQQAEVKAKESMFFDIGVQSSGAGNAGGKVDDGDFVP